MTDIDNFFNDFSTEKLEKWLRKRELIKGILEVTVLVAAVSIILTLVGVVGIVLSPVIAIIVTLYTRTAIWKELRRREGEDDE